MKGRLIDDTELLMTGNILSCFFKKFRVLCVSKHNQVSERNIQLGLSLQNSSQLTGFRGNQQQN